VLPACLVAITTLTFTAVADKLSPPAHNGGTHRYIIDSARTVVAFEVRSLGIFRQRGWFGHSSGSVTLDPQADAGCFDVLIDARTVQASSAARLRIMRGANFLNVEHFPAIAYQAQQVVFDDGKPARVDGDLTLLGVTHSVPIKVSAYQCTSPAEESLSRCTMDASAMFKRSDFGMTGSTPLAGNTIRLVIHAEATADPIDG
jgi:polyisoprenoid-binding protein YceI